VRSSDLVIRSRDVGFDLDGRDVGWDAAPYPLDQRLEPLAPERPISHTLGEVVVYRLSYEVGHALPLLGRQVFERTQLLFFQIDVRTLHLDDLLPAPLPIMMCKRRSLECKALR
jgi:hypothetical protein